MVRGLERGDPRLIGPYRLVGQLGSGGMGRVYLGLSPGGRRVAVKVIRAELAADQEFRIRFAREVAAARRVSGLFTALVVNADVDGAVPWLATVYVPGPSLAQAITRTGPLPARQALALAAGLAEGISGIHAAGLVHCDLKPSNVLLAEDGPRVIDFGISRAAGAVPPSGAGYVVGSPGFMSPEQAKGEDVGPASDIFNLGAVLTFAATGGGPFGTGSAPEVAYRLVYGPPSLNGVPAGLRPLVARCLAKDPALRPAAEDLLAEVAAAQRAAGWQPVAAVGTFRGPAQPVPAWSSPPAGRPPGQAAPGAPGRPARRRVRLPLGIATAAASVLAAAAATGFALSGAPRHPPATASVPQAAPTRAAASPGRPSPAAAQARVGQARPASRRPAAGGTARATAQGTDVVPSAQALAGPGRTTSAAAGTASRSPVVPDGTASPIAASPSAPTVSPDPVPSPAPSAAPSPRTPQITGTGTYRHGTWVFFEVRYTDPDTDAEGFGFSGLIDQHRTEGTYPFSTPNGAVIGPDSVAYPVDMECGTPIRHKAEVEVWIYGKSGHASRPAVIELSCGS